jgi:2-polyprenyl-6-methoxyphenol hydroxylase-like FAD-dependent oxidoreductase
VGVEGSRVGIVGGSIAGCAAAIALRRAGCDVTVFERSAGDLRDRGAGIVMPLPVRREMTDAGYLDAGMAACPSHERIWLFDDGDSIHGRIIWRQPFAATLNDWAVLWRTLRAKVPDDCYRTGAVAQSLEPDADGVTVAFRDGGRDRFDVVAGADGYRSIVRPAVHPASPPVYAGYVLWRGGFDEAHLLHPLPSTGMERGVVTLCFPGGHGVFYFIPGAGGVAEPGGRQVNWAVYSPAPEGPDLDDPGWLPPGAFSGMTLAFMQRFLHGHLPPYWAAMASATDPRHVSLQPIYELSLPTYVSGRLVLLGDAATITRPHTGSGATKALQDALALERACAAHGGWDEVLAAYDRERRPAGNDLVDLGRRFGRLLVEETPDWPALTAGQLEELVVSTPRSSRVWLYNQ